MTHREELPANTVKLADMKSEDFYTVFYVRRASGDVGAWLNPVSSRYSNRSTTPERYRAGRPLPWRGYATDAQLSSRS